MNHNGAAHQTVERDATLPHSSQAEEAVLGAVLKQPSSIARVSGFLRSEDFYQQRNRHVYRAMLGLFRDSQPIDYHSTADRLQQLGLLEASGGLLYLSELNLATPSAAHIEHYGRIVERTSIMRQLIAKAQTITEIAYRDGEGADSTLAKAEQLIRSIGQERWSRAADDAVDAATLFHKVLPELREAVPGLLPEGLCVMAGRPKFGKSILCLGTGGACAIGGAVLGRLRVAPSDVLYVSLEDGERRTHKRLRALFGAADATQLQRLELRWSFPRLDQGGMEALEAWLRAHPEARLVILDPWKKVRPRLKRGEDPYDAGYEAASPLHQLANHYHVCVVVVHHTRKNYGGRDALVDLVDEVLGDSGLTGAADTIVVFRRERGSGDATMHVTGREVDERALAIHREYPIGWVLQDESPDERRLSQQGRAVIKALERIGEPCGPSSVARLLGLNVNNTTKLMWTMSERGEIRLVARGLYTIAETVGKDGKDGKDEMENVTDPYRQAPFAAESGKDSRSGAAVQPILTDLTNLTDAAQVADGDGEDELPW